MENGLVIQQKSVMSVTDVMTMAEMFAKSGLFEDTKQMAQAFVKVQAGQEIGVAPFLAMTGIHIIKGKPTIGAGIIASRIKASVKYNYKVIQLDDKACSLDFYEGKDIAGNSTFSVADAVKAGTQNIGKFPKNMLFARAISNGVKWYCPDVFDGPVYVPEEMETIDIPHTEEPPVAPIDYEQNLREQGSMEDLLDYFTKMPKDAQAQFKALAGELKGTFLEDVSDEDFAVLIADISLSNKTEATALLKTKRMALRFTKEQETALTEAIAGLAKKQAA
jgi:DNA-directed RNA polymerase subunit F